MNPMTPASNLANPCALTPESDKPKRCDCVDKLWNHVKEHYDPEGYVQTKTGVNTKTGESWPSFPPLYFRYRKRNNKGQFTRQWKTSFFNMTFCPVCGQKYP
jgi:hypothetical protein